MDRISKKDRSRIMSRNTSKDTTPELVVRRAMHAHGFRYRLHDKNLPGSPDLVFPRFRAVIQVHGCYWHAHGCPRFSWPADNASKWKTKLETNRLRDKDNLIEINRLGWRQLTIWECALRKGSTYSMEELVDAVCLWLKEGTKSLSMP